jgi:DNA-binding GntR family transcriptional regulator
MKAAEKNGQGSVQDAVYTALRKSIINLNLAPGTTVSEKEISLRYKVSRTPVREAFLHLSKEGLVKVIPQRETLICPIDFGRVEQELFLRKSLEMAVLEPFIGRYRPEHIRELGNIIEAQKSAYNQDEFVNFMNFDDQFHHVFFDAAGHELGRDVLERMCGHYHRVRLLSVWLNGIAHNIISQHTEILSAVKKKDLHETRLKLNRHLNELYAEEKMLRKKFPNYFIPTRTNADFEVDFGGLPLFS